MSAFGSDDCKIRLPSASSLGKPLGKGSFSSVYKIQDARGNYAALRISSISDKTREAVANNEKKIMDKLKGLPWIVKTKSVHVCEHKDFGGRISVLVQELYDGNMSDYLNQQFIVTKEGEILTNQWLPSLAILNRLVTIAVEIGKRHVVLADAKPENFLFKQNGNESEPNIVASDFGQATFLQPGKGIWLGWAITIWKCPVLTFNVKADDPDYTIKAELTAIFMNVLTLMQSLMQERFILWTKKLQIAPDDEEEWWYGFGITRGYKFFEAMLSECPEIILSFKAKKEHIDKIYERNNADGAHAYRREVVLRVFAEEPYRTFLDKPEWNN